MGQHFLLSAAARTLDKGKIIRMSEDEAFRAYCAIRWFQTEGRPVCVWCDCAASYEIKTRWKFKCANCLRQFSPTSRTLFASHKLKFGQILWAMAEVINGAKGYGALHLARDLAIQFKTAFVLLHKLRIVMSAQQQLEKMAGPVAVDGAYFGGYLKPANLVENRIHRGLLENRTGLRQCVAVIREIGGRSIPFIVKNESEVQPHLERLLPQDEVVHTDGSGDYDQLHAMFDIRRVNHEKTGYSDPETGASSNAAEGWFSRARRMEIGIHHHVAGYYLLAYMREIAWREDRRRISNGEQYLILAAGALNQPISRYWKGYWQWRKNDGLDHNRARPKLKYRRNFSPEHVERPYLASHTIALDDDPA